MANKKEMISFRVDEEKKKEIIVAAQKAGMNNTEYILCCLESNPVVVLEDSKEIARQLVRLISMIKKHDVEEYERGVEKICLLLNTLMEKISNYQD